MYGFTCEGNLQFPVCKLPVQVKLVGSCFELLSFVRGQCSSSTVACMYAYFVVYTFALGLIYVLLVQW